MVGKKSDPEKKDKSIISSKIVQNLFIIVLVAVIVISKDWLLVNGTNIISDTVYYYYSSAAQAIATFIAFLIAGFALVYQAMDNIYLENKDKELKDIHFKLKKEYHDEIKYLSYSTGAAIIFSLITVWFNSHIFPFEGVLIFFADIFIFMTIILAILFVIKIIDPNKLKSPAASIRRADYGEIKVEGDKQEFIDTFIKLERNIWKIIRYYDIPIRYRPGMHEMIKTLRANELIDSKTYIKLKKINRYRNLVVHGDLEDVDEKMVAEVKELYEEIKELKFKK